MHENHSDCSRVAKYALVLGFSDHVQSDPTEPAQPVDTTFQSDPSQKSDKPKSPAWLLEPQQSRSRACLRQWQQELRLLKGDQSDQAMRQVGHFYK